jgi:hypothetical protein
VSLESKVVRLSEVGRRTFFCCNEKDVCVVEEFDVANCIGGGIVGIDDD